MATTQIDTVAFTLVKEHVYSSESDQAIELDQQGSMLYFFPSLFQNAGAHARLLGDLKASLTACQSRPHALGLLPPASSCGHQQWFAAGPCMRANSR
jgi:hypothetical protein